MDPSAALAAFGPPREIFPLRGLEEAEDDVVFFYDESLYMFWYRNRVWQVRFDRRFERRVLGLTMGMSRTEVEQACPAPLLAVGGFAVFRRGGLRLPRAGAGRSRQRTGSPTSTCTGATIERRPRSAAG